MEMYQSKIKRLFQQLPRQSLQQHHQLVLRALRVKIQLLLHRLLHRLHHHRLPLQLLLHRLLLHLLLKLQVQFLRPLALIQIVLKTLQVHLQLKRLRQHLLPLKSHHPLKHHRQRRPRLFHHRQRQHRALLHLNHLKLHHLHLLLQSHKRQVQAHRQIRLLHPNKTRL